MNQGMFSEFENNGYKIIEEMSRMLNAAPALPCALKIYSNAMSRYSEIFGRKDILLMAASCLMISIDRSILPISRKQMLKMFGLKEKLFNRLYRSLSSLCSKPPAKSMGAMFSGEKFIDEWTTILKLPEKVKQHARQVIKRPEVIDTLRSRLPNTIAACVIYVVCVMNDCKKSYEEIAYLASIDPSTVRSAVNLLGGVDMSWRNITPTEASPLAPSENVDLNVNRDVSSALSAHDPHSSQDTNILEKV